MPSNVQLSHTSRADRIGCVGLLVDEFLCCWTVGCPTQLTRRRIAKMGWTYNTLNPDAETSAPVIAAVGVTFTTVSFMVVALRMYVRGWMIKAIGIGEISTALEEEKKMFC